jgi:hypothetical protein
LVSISIRDSTVFVCQMANQNSSLHSQFMDCEIALELIIQNEYIMPLITYLEKEEIQS